MGQGAEDCKQNPTGIEVAKALSEEFLAGDFFTTYWEKTPLLWQASKRGRTANILPDALVVDDIMTTLLKAGSSLKLLKVGAETGDDIMLGYINGVSMVVNQADRTNETLFEMCKELASRHFAHTFCVAYLTPPGSQAVRLHTDDQDVILLQVWGKKHWTIRNNPTYLPYTEEMLGKDMPVEENVIGDPTMEFTIEPHDILYIPRGFLHEATTSDEPSLHITVTMPTSDYCWGSQFVQNFMQHVTASGKDILDAEVLSQALNCPPRDGEIDKLEEMLSKLTSSWMSRMTPTDILEKFQARMDLRNEGQDKRYGHLAQMPLPPRVKEDSRVRLMPGIVCECSENEEIATFNRIAERQHMDMPVTKSAVPIIKALTNRPQFVRSLPARDAFERLCVLQLLNDREVVQLLVTDESLNV